MPNDTPNDTLSIPISGVFKRGKKHVTRRKNGGISTIIVEKSRKTQNGFISISSNPTGGTVAYQNGFISTFSASHKQ